MVFYRLLSGSRDTSRCDVATESKSYFAADNPLISQSIPPYVKTSKFLSNPTPTAHPVAKNILKMKNALQGSRILRESDHQNVRSENILFRFWFLQNGEPYKHIKKTMIVLIKYHVRDFIISCRDTICCGMNQILWL